MKSLQDSTVAIVGFGLMGGSLAFALRAQNACAGILAIDRKEETRAQAQAYGFETSAELEAVARAEVIVLATPVRTIIELLPRVGNAARAGAIVMDLGSTKSEIVRVMETLPAHLQCIGGHPMCGKETAGLRAADAQLFQRAVFALTPLARTSPDTLAFARNLIETIGARPLVLAAARHDRLVAATSHLPYALAITLMTVASDIDDEFLFALAAGGFRDASRLAASNTTMMGDVLLSNRTNVADILRAYSLRLNELADLIEREDENTLRAILSSAAEKRRGLFQR